jgi:hypothetical protein
MLRDSRLCHSRHLGTKFHNYVDAKTCEKPTSMYIPYCTKIYVHTYIIYSFLTFVVAILYEVNRIHATENSWETPPPPEQSYLMHGINKIVIKS